MKTEEWTEWLAERFMEWIVGAMVDSVEIKFAEIVCDVPAPLVWLACTWTLCGVVITVCCVKRTFGKPTPLVVINADEKTRLINGRRKEREVNGIESD